MSQLGYSHTRRSVQKHRRERRQQRAIARAESYATLTLAERCANALSRGHAGTREYKRLKAEQA